MRITIDIRDPLLERTQRFAAVRGKDLADVVNDALAEKLNREEHPDSVAQPFQVVAFGEGGL